jgi:hypothetical protein
MKQKPPPTTATFGVRKTLSDANLIIGGLYRSVFGADEMECNPWSLVRRAGSQKIVKRLCRFSYILIIDSAIQSLVEGAILKRPFSGRFLIV